MCELQPEGRGVVAESCSIMEELSPSITYDQSSYPSLVKNAPLHCFEHTSQQGITLCMDQLHLDDLCMDPLHLDSENSQTTVKGVNTQEYDSSRKSILQCSMYEDKEEVIISDASATAVEHLVPEKTVKLSRTHWKRQQGQNYSPRRASFAALSDLSGTTAKARQVRDCNYKPGGIMVRSKSELDIHQKRGRRDQRHAKYHKPKHATTAIYGKRDEMSSARKTDEIKDGVPKTNRPTQKGCEKETRKHSLESYYEIPIPPGAKGPAKARYSSPKKPPSSSPLPADSVRENSASIAAFHHPPNQNQQAIAHNSNMSMLALTNLAEDIEKMKTTCIRHHDSEQAELKLSHSKIPTKNINILKFDMDKIKAEKIGIQNSICESTLRKESFLAYCTETVAYIIRELQSTEPFLALHDLLRNRFVIECQRYNKALPIYAQRSNILKMVSDQQTCILIGETGSGKSTQLVQYLYEAGYAENGIIACTQPRKLAAISLAKYVSKEVCESIDSTYGYAAIKVKQNKDTKVFFMTDHALLNECIADPNLSKYSCIVIDEAHERSIHSDILIALIKRCLPKRQDLKVIITSATINPTLFSSYFGGHYECPVIEVSGRTYPVDVLWEKLHDLPIVETDYVSKSVSKAFDIHVNNKGKQGDILVFLTGPSEIEQACKLAHKAFKNEAIILPLHGKLQSEEQQIVFEVTEGKRKIIFSTNVAETSVTIPGIKYVIDSGLSKEMCYDPQKNMNSLEIRPISKSSANQRKGRAGRISCGECHRLYSKDDYERMRDDSVPEILRITLAFAVMKLYEFGIHDVHSFEFVDAPDKKALDDAVLNLKFLGAIKDGKLTQLGRKMALLPLEPNLSKVLLDAIDEGLGIEGAAAVALSTLAGRVFFRPSKDELKEVSDQKRLPFCEESGDQMTHLHTYFQWSLQDNKERNKWCMENYVNGKSMRMVDQLVLELRLILKKKCGIQILPNISSLEKADHILPRLFFDAFLQSLCVHLGHDRIGYWCESFPEEQLVLHYGSSLQYLSSRPQCIVFEKTQKTSQHFVLQVLPVHDKWIRDAVNSCKIPCHPAESPLYQFYRVSSLCFANLGETVLVRLREKYHPDRRNPVSEFTELAVQPLFEYSREQGKLHVFSQKCFHDKIQRSVNQFVENIKNKLKVESYVGGIVGSNDDVRVVMGEGGTVQQVLMPDDFQAIVVRGLDKHLLSVASDELKKYGECSINEQFSQDGTVQLFIKFQNPADALMALGHTFESFDVPNVVIYRQQEKNRNIFCLMVQWPRRPRKDFTFIKFNDREYEEICALFQNIGVNWFQDPSTPLRFVHKLSTRSVRICGIELDMNLDFVKSRFLSHWPSLTEVDIYFYYESAPIPDQSTTQRQKLDDALSSFVPRTSYYLDFRNPFEKSVMYKAFVRFDDSAICLRAHQQFLRHCYFSAKLSLSSSVRYSSRVFSVVRSSVEDIAKAATQCVIKEKMDKWENVFITITANNIDAFEEAREAIRVAVEPFKLCFNAGSKCYKYTSTTCFLKAVKQIQSKTSTYMKLSSSSLTGNTLEIFGLLEKKEKAKMSVESHLNGILTDEIMVFEIEMKDHNPSVMKQLLMQYGVKVGKLVEELEGITAAKLDSRKHILTLFCTDVAHVSFLKYLDSFKGNGNNAQQAVAQGMDSSLTINCCVCYELQDSEKNFYRLEYCGHVYCKDCIEMQLASTTITFPVTCASDNCGEKFVWKDFENLFKHKVSTLQDIKSSALKHFVTLNSKVYHHCNTPDCDMVYLISANGTRFVCGQCGANICTHCHTNWHEGRDSCPEVVDATDDDTWIKKNCKKCPKCYAPIEKNGGCLKVHCRCGVNICWVCMKYFGTENECYNHLRAEHNGIFD